MTRHRQGSDIGLDIGNFSLKAVGLERISDKIHLSHLIIAEEQKGINKEDTSADSFISRTLKNNLHLPAAGKANVILSLGRPYIRLKAVSQITASGKIDSSFDHAVWFRPGLIEDIPFSKTVVDYWVISDTIKAGAPVELMAVCADEQFVNKNIIALKDLGFADISVEIDHTAILRSIKYSGILGSEERDFVFLDVGAKTSKMGIVINNKLSQVKDILVGGSSITEALANTLNISWEEAEGRKREANFLPEEGSGLSRTEQDVIATIEPLITKLAKEINLFLLSYKFVTKRPDPKKILLSGGAARMKGLDKILARELKRDVKIFNPLKGIEVEEALLAGSDPEEIGPSLAVAIGSALLPLEPKSVKTLNLIPVDLRPKRRPTNIQEMITPELVLGLIFSVLLMLYSASAVYRFVLGRKLISIEREWNQVQQEAAEIRKIRQTKKELTEKEKFVARVAGEQYVMPLVLKILSELMSDGAWVINLSMSEKVEEVAVEENTEKKPLPMNPDALPPEGVIEQGPKEPSFKKRTTKALVITGRAIFPGLVPQIMSGLKGHQLFSDVQLNDFKEQEIMGKKIINFTITCKLVLG